MTESRTTFGAELRLWRAAAGLSLAEFSRRVHYSPGYLSKIENGRSVGEDVARRLDAALGAGGELAALAPGAPSGRSSGPGRPADGLRRALPATGSAERTRSEPDGWLPGAGAAGRADLAGDPMAVLALTAGLPPLPGSGARGLQAAARDASTAAGFRTVFDGLRGLGLVVSPTVVLPMVAEQVRWLAALAGAARDADRTAVLLVGSRCAEYAGWMAQEAGDDTAAAGWTDLATRMADAGGDPELVVYALVRQAELCLHRRDAARTVSFSLRAQDDPRAPARVRGLAAQREAQGRALAGDHDGCMRALDRSRELLSRRPGGDALPLGPSSVPNSDGLVTGWCLYDLGLPERAAEVLDREVPLIPPAARRAAARFGARQALAHAAASDVETACVLADRVRDVAEQVDSATVRLDLRRLRRTLVPWDRRPRVAETRARLGAALHAAP